MFESKEFYTLFVKRGPVAANMTVDKTGFVPGEAVKISAHVKNSSKVRTTGT